jgi:hypothetical protein
MIEALVDALGIVTLACKKVGIARQTHYEWYKTDENYKQAVDDVLDVALDFAESMLHQRIQDKDTIAILFYLKTKGKRRGYIERQEFDHSGIPQSLNIIVDKSETAETLKKLKNGTGKVD